MLFRSQALHAVATGSGRIVVASAASLLPRVSAPERLLRASMELRPGTEVDPLALADLLGDAGFTRTDPVESHGTFTVRGGIVDFFPAGEEAPVRLEFIGDRVLGLIMAEWLIERFPAEQEGDLGRRLAHLVSQPVLAAVAEAILLQRLGRSGLAVSGTSVSSLSKSPTRLRNSCVAAASAFCGFWLATTGLTNSAVRSRATVHRCVAFIPAMISRAFRLSL